MDLNGFMKFKDFAGGSGGGANVLDSDGKLKDSALPDGYPYVKSGGIVEIVPMQRIRVDSSGSMIPALAEFVVDQTYTVVFDDTEYTCTAWYYGGNVIGSGSLVGNEGMGDDVPFFIGQTPEGIFVIAAEGAHTLSVSGELIEIVKIDSKFLPETPRIYRLSEGAKTVEEMCDLVWDKYYTPNSVIYWGNYAIHNVEIGNTDSGHSLRFDMIGDNSTKFMRYEIVEEDGMFVWENGTSSWTTAFLPASIEFFQQGSGELMYGGLYNPTTVARFDYDGTAWFAGGIELTSPNGKKYKITVDDNGTLKTVAT